MTSGQIQSRAKSRYIKQCQTVERGSRACGVSVGHCPVVRRSCVVGATHAQIYSPYLSIGYQQGFSLVEVIITIAIIGILTAGLMTALSGGNDSKMTALFAKAQDVAQAVSLYQAKTNCTPNNLQVLFNKALATAANNYCGNDTATLYGAADYISAMPVVAGTNNLDLAKVGFTGAYLYITKNFGGINDYVLEIGGLGATDQQAFVSKCDGVDYTNGVAMPTSAAIVTSPCVSDGAGNVAMLINKY